MHRLVEVRSYNLKPGTRSAFHDLVIKQSLPMLKRWKVDVVACGASLHDEDSYFLIRAYDSLEERQQSQDAFYGSEEWRNGPREALLELVESYASVVIEVDAVVLDGLRRTHGAR